MELSEALRRRLDLALDEATVLGFEVDPERRLAGGTFKVLMLPEHGPVPEDRLAQILLGPVGRVVGALVRLSTEQDRWILETFRIEDLLGIVQGLGELHISGRSFFDVPGHKESTKPGPSLDWQSGTDGRSHTLSMRLRRWDRSLDLVVWFDELLVQRPSGEAVDLEHFVADGERWWKAFHAGDKRTDGYGIHRLPPTEPGTVKCPYCGTPMVLTQPVQAGRCAGCGAEYGPA